MAYKDKNGIYCRDVSKREIGKLIKKGRETFTSKSIGIRDKNGEIIYEGDIVKIKKQKQRYLAVVDFENRWKKFVGRVFGGNRGNNNVSLENPDIEVIGNIFETPQLLSKLLKEKNEDTGYSKKDRKSVKSRI